MPQFRVVVPPNVREGQVVRAYVGGSYQQQPGKGAGGGGASPTTSSSGGAFSHPHATVNVRVPKGAVPGDAFIFDLPQERLDDVLLRGALSGGGSHHGAKTRGVASTSSTSSSPTAAAFMPLASEPAITDTRLVTYTDSFSEMFLGFLIGMSMVFGFFAGVLYVTDPLLSRP